MVNHDCLPGQLRYTRRITAFNAMLLLLLIRVAKMLHTRRCLVCLAASAQSIN